jgi:cyclophilin family peptidyl-prolyl cis-trans isomerase
VSKAAKRERQKANKQIKDEQAEKAQVRSKRMKGFKGLALVLFVPIVIVAALLINNATNSDVYTAQITVAIDGEKNLPNNGVIDIELDWDRAQKSSKHFIGYAKDGLYDGMEWHRVVKDFIIQSGDPKGNGSGALGSTIIGELPTRDYRTGDLAWAKAGDAIAGTAGSQFFIVTGSEKSDNVKALSNKVPQPDGKEEYQYGFIGRVTKGIAVALKIESLAPKAVDGAGPDSKPSKRAIVTEIKVFKNGKQIKRGDKSFPAATTTTIATTATTTPAPTGNATDPNNIEVPLDTNQ